MLSHLDEKIIDNYRPAKVKKNKPRFKKNYNSVNALEIKPAF